MADQEAMQWPTGIGPDAPRLDNVSYAPIEPIPPGTVLPRPSDVDLDLLFLDETEQQFVFGGLRTWEMVALHLPADGSPDEQRIWNNRPFLEPDESKWFAVFTRSHWCNVDDKVLLKFPELRELGYNDQDMWSVDDPRIWAELSKVIELANAILNLAAEGEWLQNMLLFSKTYSPLEMDDSDSFLTAAPRLPVDQRLTADAVRKWIEDEDFHKNVHWALSSPPAGCPAARRHGVTQSLPGFSHIFINIDVKALRPMLDHRSSPAQAATARVPMALTCGHSLINWTFGADWLRNLELGDSPKRSNIGPWWASQAAPWPEYLTMVNEAVHYPHKVTKGRTSVVPVYPIPNGWIRAIQQEDFWAGDVKKYGPKALEFPKILVGQMITFRHPFLYQSCRPVRLMRTAIDNQPPSMRVHMERVISGIEARRDQWRQMRPWQRDARLRWSATPWSHTYQRKAVQKLVDDNFALPRTPRKESRAVAMAFSMCQQDLSVMTVKLDHYDPDTMTADVKLTDIHPDAHQRCVKAWFYMGLGNFVMGSLPEREALHIPPAKLGQPRFYWPSAAWASDPRRPDMWPAKFYDELIEPKTFGLMSAPINLHKRHLSGVPPLLARSVALGTGMAALNEFYLIAWCVLAGLRAAVDAEYAKLVAQINVLYTYKAANTYLDFGFVLPPYVEGAPYSYKDYVAHAASLMEPKLPSLVIEGEDPLEIWTGLPTSYDGFGSDPYKAMRVVSQAAPDYLTIAELYDLRRQRKCGEFVLVRSGLDLEVYDQDILRQALGCTQAELQESVERSHYGWCLNEKTADRFRARQAEEEGTFDRPVPMAKVVQWVTPEEVVLQDGKDGRRTWIMAGDQVYDVSELSLYPADGKLEKLLLSHPGGNPMMMVNCNGYKAREVIKKLRQYRVAMILPQGLSMAQGSVRMFTSEELAWHEFRETGIYLQIYDDVYDVSTAYLDLHPGGIDILSAYAGRDATKAFEKYHPENGKKLLEGIQALKIGRMIKSYQPDAELEVGEVRIRDRVFLGDEATAAVKGLKGNPTEEFEAALKRMVDGGADEPIITLWNKRQDLVVGRFTTPPEALSTITERQMKAFNGEAQDSCFEHAAFMAVDGVVYDISTLLRFGHPTVLGVLRQYAGRICTDKKVGNIMKTRYAFRAVARLSAHEAKDGVDWDPRRLRHDIEDVDLQRLAKKYVPLEPEDKKRKFNAMTGEEEEVEELPLRRTVPSRMPMPRPTAGGGRPAKRRDGGVGEGSKWLDWKTEGLVEELQEKFASGQIFGEWQARERERFEREAREMEGYWEKVAEEKVGA